MLIHQESLVYLLVCRYIEPLALMRSSMITISDTSLSTESGWRVHGCIGASVHRCICCDQGVNSGASKTSSLSRFETLRTIESLQDCEWLLSNGSCTKLQLTTISVISAITVISFLHVSVLRWPVAERERAEFWSCRSCNAFFPKGGNLVLWYKVQEPWVLLTTHQDTVKLPTSCRYGFHCDCAT